MNSRNIYRLCMRIYVYNEYLSHQQSYPYIIKCGYAEECSCRNVSVYLLIISQSLSLSHWAMVLGHTKPALVILKGPKIPKSPNRIHLHLSVLCQNVVWSYFICEVLMGSIFNIVKNKLQLVEPPGVPETILGATGAVC